MDLELGGKVALVTGSSRGIGRAIAEALAAEGCKIMLTGRDEPALAEAARALAARSAAAHSAALDLQEPAAAGKLVEATRKAFGRLDILVNNAGHTLRGDFLKQTDEDWQQSFAMKFFAHVRLTRAAWPLLTESRGSVVMIGGTAGKQTTANSMIGGSVNAALLAFNRALAEIGTKDGVQVNLVSPGHVDTDRLRQRLAMVMRETGLDLDAARERYRERLGAKRIGRPEDVANFVAFIASSRGSWLHGSCIDLHGGQIRPI